MTAITIIIPCWNSEKYLPGTLESIRRQSFGDWKVLIVNDGSTDGSAAVVQQFATTDPRFELIDKPNGGVSSARNCGLNQAESEFIFFLDADDYLHPQALETLHKVSMASGAAVVECEFADTAEKFENYNPQSLPDKPEYELCNKPLYNLIERKKVYTPTIWNKLYRRDCIGDLRYPDCCIFEDVAFATCLAAKLDCSLKIRLPLVNYFNDNSSLTRSSFSIKKIQSYARGISYVDSFFRQHYPQELPRIKRQFFSWYVRVMINSVNKCKGKQDNYSELRSELSKQLRELKRQEIIGLCGLSWGKKLNFLSLLFTN